MKYAVGVLCAVLGSLAGHYLFEGAAAAYASLLLSYHLFLAVVVFSAVQEKGLSMPIGMTILTHMAVLALLLGLAYGRENIPFFGLIRWCIPALAPFESKWLFSGTGKITVEAEPQQAIPEATAEDHEEFRVYLTQPERAFRKPGISINDEFNLWLADRHRRKTVAEAETRAAAQHEALPVADTGVPAATPTWGWMQPESTANSRGDAEPAPGGAATDGNA